MSLTVFLSSTINVGPRPCMVFFTNPFRLTLTSFANQPRSISSSDFLTYILYSFRIPVLRATLPTTPIITLVYAI